MDPVNTYFYLLKNKNMKNVSWYLPGYRYVDRTRLINTSKRRRGKMIDWKKSIGRKIYHRRSHLKAKPRISLYLPIIWYFRVTVKVSAAESKMSINKYNNRPYLLYININYYYIIIIESTTDVTSRDSVPFLCLYTKNGIIFYY